jgi:Uma2 family endonuclease
MSTLIDIRDVPQHLVLRDVSWEYYEQTLRQIGDQAIHVAFLDGVMELMSPLPKHEGPKKAIGNMIVELCLERRIRLKCFGSTTFRIEEKAAGSEPDECFYFNEIESVAGMEHFDPMIHRAPDLWVEVDILSGSMPREPICARLGVPEIWRYDGQKLAVRLLTPRGTYEDSKTSNAFAFLPVGGFAEFISQITDGDEMTALLKFRDWVRRLA